MIANQKQKKDLIEDLLGSRARIKILKSLVINEELTISLIIKKTKLNHVSVSKHLNYLKISNIVQEKNFGRIKIFRLKLENIKVRSLKNFIEIWDGDF